MRFFADVIREEQESKMTTKTIEGDLNAGGAKFGLVVSRFNSLITERLLEGAMDYTQKWCIRGEHRNCSRSGYVGNASHLAMDGSKRRL